MIALLTLIPLLAFLYRCRGGLFPLGSTQAARVLYWAIPNAIVSALLLHWYGINPWGAVFTGIAVWGAATVPHGQWMGSHDIEDTEMMAAIGWVQVTAMFIPLVFFFPKIFPLFFLGTLEGVAYCVGWRYLDGVRFTSRGRLIAENGAEWGELLSGASFGLIYVILFAVKGA